MTLLELCEPLFHYICRVNRSARKGGNVSHGQIRAEIDALFKEIHTKAAGDPGLENHLDRDKGKIELVLAFFVDFMVKESKLPFADEWQELGASKFNALAGDEQFWDLLEEALADRSEVADERLAVYYTCIGLGFTGWYSGQPEYLRRKMSECSARIRGMMDVDENAPIVSESELYVNTDNLIEPPGKSLMGIGIALLGLTIALFIGNIYLYHHSTSELVDSLDNINASRDPENAREVMRAPSQGQPDSIRRIEALLHEDLLS